MLHVLVWWLLIQILGLAALSLAYRVFKWMPGRGYAFAKPLGLLLASYIVWLGASLGYLRNTSGGILLAITLVAAISLWLHFRRDSEDDRPLLTFLREHGRLVLTVEILFAASLCIWALLRAYAPDKIMSSGGEKFMEIAFLNAILRSQQFPPHDPWLSGYAISYYYFGYVMMASLTRLSGVASGVGFELYNASLFALTVTGAFGVVYNLVAGGTHESPDDAQALRYGLLGSLFVAVMGNLEGILEAFYAKGILPASFWRWIDIPDLVEKGQVTGSWYPGHGWWWWRASRVLRDRNLLGEPMPLNPIDEFPFFSFLLGDNHPHVLALPFVLLAMAMAFNLLRRGRESSSNEQSDAGWWDPVARCLDEDWTLFTVYALALGALGFLNTWDFPIYLILTALAYGTGRYAAGMRPAGDLLPRIAVLGVGLSTAGVLLYLPFYIGFHSQAGGVLPYLLPPTRLAQYMVMFGPFVFVAAWFLITHLRRGAGGRDKRGFLRPIAKWWGLTVLVPIVLFILAPSIVLFTGRGRQFIQSVLASPHVRQVVGSGGPAAVIKAVILARLRDPGLFLALSLLIALAVVNLLRTQGTQPGAHGSTASDRFASLLILVGLGLTFSVEFIYLRDSFGVRMNTVFKFYYQAWVMLGCAGAYGVWRVLNWPGINERVQKIFLAGTALLTAAGLVYPLMASYSRVQGFRHQPNLNGAINIARSHPRDWAAIEWLRDNAQGVPIILEAPGKSYNYEGRISAFTGFPTVLGWAVHESQWRGNYVEQGKREPDIATIYTTHDGERALELLHKWRVDYVVLGAPERRYVEELCASSDRQCDPSAALKKFDGLLEPVFQQGHTAIYRCPRSDS